MNEKTHGKIKEILDEIPADAILYLINAIYFKAMWQYAFDKDLTSSEYFFPEPNLHAACRMMKVTADLNYYSDPNVQIVELPYGIGSYSALLFLPNYDIPVNEFVNSLDSETWSYYLGNLNKGIGTVELPKFKLEYDLLMNDVLIRMGMGVAFSGSADFSRINPDRPIAISRVIHKTFVQVDEEGTEAAAVTVIEFERTSSGDGSNLDFYFRFNRPFLFAVYEKVSKTIIFLGKIQRPEWTD